MAVRTTETMHELISAEFARSKSENTSREHRMKFAHDLIEKCIADRGEKPGPMILQRLGTLILQDEFRDSRSNKVRCSNYPILSSRQERRRRTGTGTSKKSLMGEISETALAEIGIDKRSYRLRTRTNNRRFREFFKI